MVHFPVQSDLYEEVSRKSRSDEDLLLSSQIWHSPEMGYLEIMKHSHEKMGYGCSFIYRISVGYRDKDRHKLVDDPPMMFSGPIPAPLFREEILYESYKSETHLESMENFMEDWKPYERTPIK